MTDKNDKPVVNFAILQSVEDYTKTSGKFRTKCSSFRIPGQDSGGANALYIPYCDKQRFDFGPFLNDLRGHGAFHPPETGKRWQMMDFILFRERFHDIHCPRPCRGYRNKTVAALLDKVLSVFGAKLHEMPIDSPATPPSMLKQAINAVPAVKYALGVGGIISVVAIVGGFKIDYRVALLGAVVMLVLMTVLLVFAKASSRPQSAFKVPAIILTWFCLVLFMATATALFSSVFFGKPLDLRTLLAPVHAERMPVEKHGTVEVLPPTTGSVDVTVKRAPSQTITATVGHEKKKLGTKESHASTTTTASGSIVNNGGVINNPTINNNSPHQEDVTRRTIQDRLSQFVNTGLSLRDDWQKVLGGAEEVQRPKALAIQDWHKQVESYLKTIPRGQIYLVRFGNPIRSSGVYPVGINVNLSGTWDLLLSDLARLNEFVVDPDLGKP